MLQHATRKRKQADWNSERRSQIRLWMDCLHVLGRAKGIEIHDECLVVRELPEGEVSRVHEQREGLVDGSHAARGPRWRGAHGRRHEVLVLVDHW